jgi:hypothetical protein
MGGSKSRTKFVFNKARSPLTISALSKEPKSVQQRLEESRREASRPKSSFEAIERIKCVNSVATTSTKPLETRELLQIPETASIQQRRRRNARGQRGPAGPPAPRSWGLASSCFAPARITSLARQEMEDALVVEFDLGFSRIAKINDQKLASHKLPSKGSLKYYSLKTMAKAWPEIKEYYYPEDFECLETGIKSALLTYLGRYQMEINREDLDILFRDRDSKDLKRLDLTDIVGKQLTVKDVSKFLANPKNSPTIRDIDQTMTTVSSAIHEDKFESWEDEANLIEAQLISKTIGGSAFIHLTHISLANPGPNVSWSDLLELAPKLNLLTHLSLAYWRTPLLRRDTSISTPEALQRLGLGRSRSVSEAERTDWDEPAHVLRSLSKSTYSLEWLDLEGCNEWLPALAVSDGHGSAIPNSPTHSTVSSSSDEDALWRDGIVAQAKGPDWNGSWSKLKYVRIAPQWLPGNVSIVKTSHPSLIRDQMLLYLREKRREQGAFGDGYENDQWSRMSDYEAWEAQEQKDRAAVSKIRSQVNRYVHFDHGWEPVVRLAEGAQRAYTIRPMWLANRIG